MQRIAEALSRGCVHKNGKAFAANRIDQAGRKQKKTCPQSQSMEETVKNYIQPGKTAMRRRCLKLFGYCYLMLALLVIPAARSTVPTFRGRCLTQLEQVSRGMKFNVNWEIAL